MIYSHLQRCQLLELTFLNIQNLSNLRVHNIKKAFRFTPMCLNLLYFKLILRLDLFCLPSLLARHPLMYSESKTIVMYVLPIEFYKKD